MAEQALEVELKNETVFLSRYDDALKRVDQKFDIRGNVLSSLVMLCLDNNGVISNNRRKQFADRAPEAVFDFIEQCVKETAPSVEDSAPTPCQ
jgi:hypothetical protein